MREENGEAGTTQPVGRRGGADRAEHLPGRGACAGVVGLSHPSPPAPPEPLDMLEMNSIEGLCRAPARPGTGLAHSNSARTHDQPLPTLPRRLPHSVRGQPYTVRFEPNPYVRVRHPTSVRVEHPTSVRVEPLVKLGINFGPMARSRDTLAPKPATFPTSSSPT